MLEPRSRRTLYKPNGIFILSSQRIFGKKRYTASFGGFAKIIKMNSHLWLLSVCLVLSAAFLHSSSADDDSNGGDDSGERPKGNQSGEDESNSSEEDDDFSPPKFCSDTLHGHQKFRLDLVYHDANLVVYFDKGVNRSVKWPFQSVSKAWSYVKAQYQPCQRGEDHRLWLKLHSWFTHPQALKVDKRYVVDLKASSEKTLVENSVEQMAALVESSVLPLNFTWILSNVSRPLSIIAYDILKNSSLDLANKWMADMKSCGGSVTSHKTSLNRWYYPLYLNCKGGQALKKFFKLVVDYYAESKSNHAMCWKGFYHFWSGATGLDQRALLTSAFNIHLSQEDVEYIQKKVPQVTYCVGK